MRFPAVGARRSTVPTSPGLTASGSWTPSPGAYWNPGTGAATWTPVTGPPAAAPAPAPAPVTGLRPTTTTAIRATPIPVTTVRAAGPPGAAGPATAAAPGARAVRLPPAVRRPAAPATATDPGTRSRTTAARPGPTWAATSRVSRRPACTR